MLVANGAVPINTGDGEDDLLEYSPVCDSLNHPDWAPDTWYLKNELLFEKKQYPLDG
jgi:hypothetical protein